MAKAYKLKVENKDPFATVSSFFKKLLTEKVVDALLVPSESVKGASVIQTLVRSSEELRKVNCFAPLLLSNSATLISQLTADNPTLKLGVVLRSCEIRAAIELVKLKQVNIDNVIIIGVDCLGTYESNVYQKLIQNFGDSQKLTRDYLAKSQEACANIAQGNQLRLACESCEYPNPENADIAINFIGLDLNKELLVQVSDKPKELNPESFGLSQAEDIKQWQDASKKCQQIREKSGDKLIKETLAGINNVGDFLKELEHCRRCYNCRKECPICYCRECIFDSLTFEHESDQYLNWAKKRGKIRMPSDTLLFHLTRMNHMVISCVACGQCTSACPNNIPVAKFFKTMGSKVQALFDYKPGRSVDEENPQSTFKEDEFPAAGKAKEKNK